MSDSRSSLLLPLLAPALLGLLLAGIVGAFALPKPPADSVEFPVEVIGVDGTTRTIHVDVQDPEAVDSLYLKAYSVGYPQHAIDERGYTVSKASIRLNGSSWVDIDNGVARCKRPEKTMQCVTGPMHTIRFEIAVADLGQISPGANRIDFRFNHTGPDDRDADAPADPSAGFRILDIEMRDAGDTDHIDGTTFHWDDPSTWTAPEGYGDAASIEAGRELWHERDLLVDFPGGPPITAACADCHADDGRDLAYFAFSNASIVGRSQFHELTERQGKKIAAYIRSLDLEDPDTGQSYDPPGRPWHPPYQPGPTAVGTRSEDAPRSAGQSFEDVDSQLWAAGAGVAWSLDHDAEMLPHLFPDGVSLDDVHPDASLNVRSLPIALQLPDWNEWLPAHHPLDTYGETFRTVGDPGAWETYTESTRKNDFEDVRACMRNQSRGASCVGKLSSALNWFTRVTNEHRSDLGAAPDVMVPGHEIKYSLMRWMAVKQWELIHTYDFMDEARHQYGDAAPLQWPIPHRSVFNHASHIISADLKGPKHGTHDPYFDTAWYDLQLILNSGQGISTNISPMDWKYHFGHIYERSDISDWPQALRYIRSYVRIVQNANGEVPEQFHGDKYPQGWFLRHTQPGWLDRFPSEELDGYQPGLSSEVLTEVLRAWYLGAVPGNDWAGSCRDGGQWCIEPESTDPEFITAWQPSQETVYANTIFSTVAFLRDEGVEPSILDSLRNWGRSLWPDATDPTWAELIDASASLEISLDAGWNLVSFHVAPEAPAMDDVLGQVEEVTIVKDEKGRAFVPSQGLNELGRWRMSEGYMVHVENPASVTVSGLAIERSAPISLSEGWNLLPVYPRTPVDAAVALSPIEETLVRVEDEEGRVYSPASGRNEIGDLRPGQAYKVYVSENVQFQYPPDP